MAGARGRHAIARTARRLLVLPAVACAAAVLAASGCAPRRAGDDITLRFWAMGAEGEAVQPLIADFEAENPGIHVEVQQIPWSAAHEKLLTCVVGRSTPDVSQLGNTWVAEFAALRALEPLGPLLAGSHAVRDSAYFRGIWDTNVIEGTPFGIPWYVDTRVLFYRTDILRRAGYSRMPDNWRDWRACMVAVKKLLGPQHYALLMPSNEFEQPLLLALQAGAPFLAEHDTRGAFQGPEFRRAFEFYTSLYRDGLAPGVSDQVIANLYQEFAKGTFAMFISGPWNVAECRKRLPDSLQNAWATAPLPGPDGPSTGFSSAGGSSLVLFRNSPHPAEAWKLIEFLSRPEQQVRFYHLSGDLPARVEAWADTAFTNDPRVATFGEQLKRVKSGPIVPEWNQIQTQFVVRAEPVVRGTARADSALAQLDRDVDRMLEKRRWLLARAAAPTGTAR